MNIGPTINQTISVQASATCFELKAQALVFYDALNVKAERLEGSLGEKYSRWPARFRQDAVKPAVKCKGRIPDVLAMLQ